MNVSSRVRRIYEKRPYPFGDNRALKACRWRPPLEWIDAIWKTDGGRFSPERILIAGCGDGAEAFLMSRRFPRSEIVAVDFSSRSIAVAKRLQKGAPRMRNIRFLRADLTDPRLPAALGGEFDLILCHGVLSYFSAPGLALRNFARCLKPDGALYLGVNGAAHPSAKLRQALPAFGFDMAELGDEARLRDVLRLCDAALEPNYSLADKSREYLGSDLFGPHILNLPLADWTQGCRKAGLHLLGSLGSLAALKRIGGKALCPILLPRSRSEVCEFLELLSPSSFHRLLFSKRPELNPPWEKHSALLGWRVISTKLYDATLPKLAEVRDRLRAFKIKNSLLNILIEWRMPEWEIEILRQGDGKQSLRSVLDGIPLAVPAKDLCDQLFLLYQLGVINLLPA